MVSHEDDLLGGEPPGGQDGQQADGAVADHGDTGARADAARHGGMVAGAEDIREGQQGRDEGRVGRGGEFDQGAVGERDADRLGLGALGGLIVPEAGLRVDAGGPGRAAPAAAAGTMPAWASPNETEPAMKPGRPSAVGSPSSVPAAAGAALSAAMVSCEDVPVLIVCSLVYRSELTPVVAGLSGPVMKVQRG